MTLPPPPAPRAPDTGGAVACYRHPDRDAGRSCTRCGRPACADCLVQATVGSHCRECAKAGRPDLRTRARFWHARQPAIVTTILIAINLAVFAYVTVRDPQSLGGVLTIGQAELGLPSGSAIVDGFAIPLRDGTFYVSGTGEWYRLVTSGFVHFGIIHIGFNMYLLFLLGQMLEPQLGRVRYLLVYVAGLLGGSAGSLLIDRGAVSAGASGAVFGLMGLAFVGYYLHGANPLTTWIGSLLMLNLFITFLIPRISIGGHLGGAAAGAICALVVLAPRHRGIPRWATYAAPVAVIAIAAVVAASVVTG